MTESMTKPAPGLTVNKVCLRINQQRIMDNLDFILPVGRVLGILGPNGAGKTSLLRTLSGQGHAATTGTVTWQGHSVAAMGITERARKIAVVNQLNDPVFALSLQQIVRMGLLPHQSLLGIQRSDDDARIVDALERVGLSSKASQLFSSLSGGEQQRGLIARALVQQADLIVLDEPVNHLDVFYQHETLFLLKELAHQSGITVVMSLHDLNLASMYCDYLALLHHGELIGFGSPVDVLNAPQLQRVFGLPCQVCQVAPGDYVDGYTRVDFFPKPVPALSSSQTERKVFGRGDDS